MPKKPKNKGGGRKGKNPIVLNVCILYLMIASLQRGYKKGQREIPNTRKNKENAL